MNPTNPTYPTQHMSPIARRRARRFRIGVGAMALLASAFLGGASIGAQSTGTLPRYEGAKGVAGSIRIGGSSAPCGLLARVAEAFQAAGAAVKVETTGSDDGAGVAALADGSVDLAVTGRPLNADERSRIQSRQGTAPIEVVVGLDAVAIYVHKDNAIRHLTVQEVASLFGNGAGGAATAKQWGDLTGAAGVSAELASQPVAAFGVRRDSSSSALLRQTALRGADFRNDLSVQRVPTGVISGVGANKAGVGYASPSFRSSQATRLVPVAATGGAPAREPTQDALLDGSYPLGGKVYVSFVRKQGAAANPAAIEFLRFLLSRDGQEAAVKEGSIALPASVVAQERQKLG